MASALCRVCFLALAMAVAAAAQGPPPSGLQASIDSLSNFDYSTRMNAARMIRRAEPREAVPALTTAVRSHRDEFVRYRALVLLTAFNHPSTADLMRTVMSDRNDRLREVAYRWFERHPDPALTPTLLAALNTEQAEFVRPVLVRALAALGRDPQVQRALLAEVGRGLDFFRSAVIEALGDHGATYAVDALSTLAASDGPLQDDAVLALGRIGDPRALTSLSMLTTPPPDIVPVLQAALCLLDDSCEARVTVLSDTARSRAATAEARRAAVSALGAVAARGHSQATAALVSLADEAAGAVRDDVAIGFSAAALRNPAHIIGWIERASDDARPRLVELLREGFESLEEEFAEEQFFAAARASYWAAPDGAATRTVAATLIDRLEF